MVAETCSYPEGLGLPAFSFRVNDSWIRVQERDDGRALIVPGGAGLLAGECLPAFATFFYRYVF